MALSDKIVAFNAIQTIGLLGAFVIVVTSFLTSSIRHISTWYLVLCSSGVYSLSMLLLAISHAQSGPEPNSTLCLVQAVLIYSTPIWLMGSVCMYAVQIYLTVLFYSKQYSGLIHRESRLLNIVKDYIQLSIGMVSIFVGVTVALSIAGALRPQITERSPQEFYCHFTNDIGVIVVGVFGFIFAVIAVVCEFKTGVLLYRHCNAVDFYQQSDGCLSIGVLVRLASFSLISILSVSLQCRRPSSGPQQGEPLNGFLHYIILTQISKSIIHVWMFWTKNEKKDQLVDGNNVEEA
ncbi:hypothetical protein J3R30DRAFT_3403914 [Lentinula aciculospora]|uniref:Uncharacterized protein n=1 Tax=Lentinula aciculospora TaxID=153920 RepID=A0A9W9ABL3_9AGAR|nr:hypothetical protein J3R30DRAFT_3403914 [Lentinula aciculospora]